VLNDDEKKRLLARLKRCEGQTRGVMRMVEEDQYCVDVMNQVAAIQGALAEVSKKLLSRHLDTCVRGAIEDGGASDKERVLHELQDLFARYGRIDRPKR
jgi:DNA-binding FrmR family transcriptional regulator